MPRWHAAAQTDVFLSLSSAWTWLQGKLFIQTQRDFEEQIQRYFFFLWRHMLDCLQWLVFSYMCCWSEMVTSHAFSHSLKSEFSFFCITEPSVEWNTEETQECEFFFESRDFSTRVAISFVLCSLWETQSGMLQHCWQIVSNWKLPLISLPSFLPEMLHSVYVLVHFFSCEYSLKGWIWEQFRSYTALKCVR